MRIRIDSRQLGALLEDRAVTAVHRGTLPVRGQSHAVVLHEPTDLHAIVVRSRLRPHTLHAWDVDLTLDHSARPMLLNAESQTAIHQLGESADPDSAEAHGYTDREGQALDAGEGVPPAEVATFARSQAAATRFNSERVDVLARQRARSTASRVRDALMQARAHGVDTDPALEAIDEELKAIHAQIRAAA